MSRLGDERRDCLFFLGGLETLKVKKEIQKEREKREIFEHFLVRLFSAHTASRETRIKRRGFLLSYSKNARHSEKKKTRCLLRGGRRQSLLFSRVFFGGKGTYYYKLCVLKTTLIHS